MEHYEDWEQKIDQKIKEKENEFLAVAQEKSKNEAEKEAKIILQTIKQKLPKWKHFGRHEKVLFVDILKGDYDQDSLSYEVSRMLKGIGLIDLRGRYKHAAKHTTVCKEIAPLLKEHIDTLYIEDSAYQYFLNQNVTTKRQRLRSVFEEKETKEEMPMVITKEEEEELSILMRIIMKEIIDFTFLQKKNLANILHAILDFREHHLYKTNPSTFSQFPSYSYLRENIEMDCFHSLIERYKKFSLRVIDQTSIDLVLSGQIHFKEFNTLRNYLYLASDPIEMRNKLKEGIIKSIEEKTGKIEEILQEDVLNFLYNNPKIAKEKEIVKTYFDCLEQVRKDEQDETNM